MGNTLKYKQNTVFSIEFQTKKNYKVYDTFLE